MKKKISILTGVAAALLFTSANAQVDTTMKADPVTTTSTTSTTDPAADRWNPKNNPTVDSINAKYKDQLVASREAITTEQIFPVLGQYESTANADAASVKVTLDEQNKGMVWVEGLPQGKIKAMLRQSPSTYKIPAQKTEDDKEVAEGTLHFNKDANTLHIVIGKPYNTQDPASVFATPAIGDADPVADNADVKVKTKEGKSKVKVKTPAAPKAWTYTGTKIETATVMTPAVGN